MLKGWKPIKCAVGYVMSNKQQCQQFWKVGSTQNIITALMLLRVIKKIDFMTLMSSLKALEVQRCGDVSGTVGAHGAVSYERMRVLGRLWWLWGRTHRCGQQWGVLVVSHIGASLTHAFLQTCIHRGAYQPESTACG